MRLCLPFSWTPKRTPHLTEHWNTHILECVSMCLFRCLSLYFASVYLCIFMYVMYVCMRVYVCQMGAGQKQNQKRMCHEWLSFVCCVRFYGSHENTRYKRLIHTYVCCVKLSIRLPYWMVFDYYRVMGAWRSFHVNPSYGNKEYRNTHNPVGKHT